MKLGKKLMVVAMAVATFSMVGCALNQDGEGAIKNKKIDFDNSYIKINDETKGDIEHIDSSKSNQNGVTENSEWFYRAVKQLATKHYSSTCVMTINPNNTKTDAWDGVMGYFVAGKENTEWNNDSCDDMNCIMISVRYCAKDDCLESYISKYNNISFKDNNFTKNTNLYGKDNVEAKPVPTDGAVATEKEYLSGEIKPNNAASCSVTKAYVKLSGDYKVKDAEKSTYKIAIEAVANSDGSYTIKYYNVDDQNKKTGTGEMKTIVTGDNKEKADPATSGFYKKTQTNLGWYASVYPKQHLTGKWEFTDTEGNVIPVE